MIKNDMDICDSTNTVFLMGDKIVEEETRNIVSNALNALALDDMVREVFENLESFAVTDSLGQSVLQFSVGIYHFLLPIGTKLGINEDLKMLIRKQLLEGEYE